MKKSLGSIAAMLAMTSVMAGCVHVSSEPPKPKLTSDMIDLCNSFDRAKDKDLLRPTTKASFEALVKKDVPKELGTLLAAYYDGERLDGETVDMFSNDRRERLNDKRENFLAGCAKYGWSEQH